MLRKIIIKLLIGAVALAAVSFGPAVGVYANADRAQTLAASITTRRAPRVHGSRAQVTGDIPDARNVENTALRAELQTRFAAQASVFSQAHQAHAHTIDHSVETFISGNFVSVVLTMEAQWATTATAVATTVINANTNQIVSLDQYHANARVLVNSHIRGMIAANPRNFISNFNGIAADHPFYLDGGRLVIPFGSAGLIPTNRAVHTVEILIENIRGMIVGGHAFFQLPQEQYNTIMVRLVPVLEHFEYAFTWDGVAQTVTISAGGRVISIVTIGENEFFYRNSGVRELEAAPVLRAGMTYVPLSFFDEMIGMSTTVDLGGRQIFLNRYMTAESGNGNMSHLQ